jgi:ketol-acid reductoisomerase
MKQADLDHPIEVVGKRLRAKMVWLQNDAATKPTAAGAVSRDRPSHAEATA